MMTKGQAEAKIGEIFVKFEKLDTGIGASEVKAYFIKDTVYVRLKGVLTHQEKALSESKDGRHEIKTLRAKQLDISRAALVKEVEEALKAKVMSVHTDISGKTGGRIFVLEMDKVVEAGF
ncbi:MAG: hypothetical protein BWY84_00153 [Candidatus Aerophobetes bacterium ADurb.Bin490]|nr:MAG: hypothetical protein BWY84_00153 [Candidatus Aerophobetes bacterium ADurb.Bin490]HNZ28928.1 Na-translocating system protein MpsC family protein [Candidatus Goldiibacteriota bacterium]HPI02227.1 Na-translocating system protein MpsC family protein [Candidatus Goldiibacteriota bacterium]HPN65661.1 Na-translocating system protein MpsC family protein [Candidatus Goldiibacteriota bacterium]HRQ43604.1 Na-translocating system protein MpsC family protein [Candidatus Goldiibacteriota bacterium]